MLGKKDMKRENKFVQIIIDTNVWISFFIGKMLSNLQYYIANEQFQIITCAEQVVELKSVLSRRKITKYISQQKVDEFINLLDEKAKLIEIISEINICRDQKDNYLLSLAIDSSADFLISGDLDLLSIKQIGNTKIINFKEFENIFLHTK